MIWNLCEVKRIRNITIKPTLKEILLKSIQKGTGILPWIISYRKESRGLNPPDFAVSHSLPATLWSGEGRADPTAVTLSSRWSTVSWKSSGGDSQLSLHATACRQKHAIWKGSEWRYLPQTIRSLLWMETVSYLLNCAVCMHDSPHFPLFWRKEKESGKESNFQNETSLVWFYDFKLQQFPFLSFSSWAVNPRSEHEWSEFLETTEMCLQRALQDLPWWVGAGWPSQGHVP